MLLSQMFADLIAARYLAYRLLLRNFQSQYRQSLLGYVWALFPSIATAAGFVFLTSNKILQIEEPRVPYPVYVFIGIVLWQTFIDALHGPLRWVSLYRAVIARVNFPREALILGALGEVVVNLAIRVVLLALLMAWYGIVLTPNALLAPILVFGLIGVGFMFGLAIVPLGLLYGDVEKGLSLVTMLWFFLTPIFYVPPVGGLADLINRLNPVSPLLIVARELLLAGNVTHGIGAVAVLAITAISLFLAWILFRLAMPHLIERIGQ
jgi:lipopolysaccharide transport system permease protein